MGGDSGIMWGKGGGEGRGGVRRVVGRWEGWVSGGEERCDGVACDVG